MEQKKKFILSFVRIFCRIRNKIRYTNTSEREGIHVMDKSYRIEKIGAKLNLPENALIPFGFDKAKLDVSLLKGRERKAKLVLVTAITPTKAGEGKTTTSVGLADGLSALGKNVVACLREPSLGPVFGVKGGGAGGGEATLYPEDDINLHFTGDFHALTSANNLIAALIDNELYQQSDLDVDPERIIFPRAMDMNERSLRDITVAQGDPKAIPHHSSFVITAASEMMAIFCLAKDEEDFLDRVENITVAYNRKGDPIFVRQLEARGAIRKLMHLALYPNLVQTKYHTPAIVHGGPFANIAHGCNSLIATDAGLRLADYVITEAGFGSDLGAEKFLDIVAPLGKFHPDEVVMVCSIRALKLHGGVRFEELKSSDVEAMMKGTENLCKHLENIAGYGVPYVVAINKFPTDSQEEIEALENFLRSKGIPFSLNSSYEEGPKGAISLAKCVLSHLGDKNNYHPIVNDSMSPKEKIETISKSIYGAKDVEYAPGVLEQLKEFEKSGYGNFKIVISKVPTSLSDDPHLLNVPKDITVHVQSLRLFTGAGFIVPLTGNVYTMPGLPKVPASKGMNR